MRHIFLLLFSILSGLLVINCSSENDTILESPEPLVLSDEVEIYEANLIDNGLVLAIENGGKSSYLIDKTGKQFFNWDFEDNLGNDFELLPTGKSLGMFKSENPTFSFGGFGGVLKIINPDGSTDWEFNYTSDTYIAHHDAELLPNGNVLFLVWEKIDANNVTENGVDFEEAIYPEKLVEVNPTTNEIVWEWRSWDHIIQDYDDTKKNFGVVADHPELIDINYNLQSNGDFMHANGIDYDAQKDVIYISVNFFSEVWVIDHSTTTVQAATSSGGFYGKGGDLLYRFGNPEAYDNNEGNRLFYQNHFPNLLEDGEPGEGNLLIYVNNGPNNLEQSSVYELKMPAIFSLSPNINNEPSVVWSYTNTELFSGRISGAVRLTNGNTLICEGDYGFWEITPDKEIAWKYNGAKGFWRAYGYDLDFEGLANLGLAPL